MFVAIMGYGTVGSGVAAVLKQNGAAISKKCGCDSIEVKKILDIRKFPGDPFEDKITADFQEILTDPEIKIVAETMGGLHPAYDFVLALLEAGKSVVTSNKELVAVKGKELLDTAAKNGVNFLFEASTGGGIPVLRPITQCLVANEITEVAGILNGTTNYILTKMITEGTSFEAALADAQNLGYAERDPSADVDGIDALRKICILADLCFGKNVSPESVKAIGIRGVTLADVEAAKALGGVIKLIASAKKTAGGKIAVTVSPAFIKNGSQTAACDDVFNCILVRGDAVGEVCFYGPGAGKMPTASAVVADIADCAKHGGVDRSPAWEEGEDGFVVSGNDFTASWLVRATGDKAKVREQFPDVGFLNTVNSSENDLLFITEEIPYGKVIDALKNAGAETGSVIRITDY